MSVKRVMRIIEDEQPGDHWLSHWVMARKVLRTDCATAIRIADAFRHRALTRDECDGLVSDWRDAGWL